MEMLVDRVLDILRAFFPGEIAKLNAYYEAADIEKYGAPLTLANPNEYIYGPVINMDIALSLQVRSERNYVVDESEGGVGERIFKVIVDLPYDSDDQEITNRIVDRYRLALENVLAKRLLLPNPETGYGEMAKRGKVVDNRKNIVIVNNTKLFHMAIIEMEYGCSVNIINELAGL